MKHLEESVRSSLVAFQETVGEDLKESNKNITGSRRKGNPFCVEVESLAALSVSCIHVESSKCP